MQKQDEKVIGFSRKIFLAVFLSCLGILTLSVLATSKILSSWILDEYQDRYSALSSMIGENIRELEGNAEKTMLNAALLVRSLDKNGTLSTAELKDLAQQTNVTHLFIIDKNGEFIRSTNEDPSLIPNFYSFCSDYQGMLGDQNRIEATPIIKPNPEPAPFKFLIISNATGERFINVGLRVDFLANSLKRFQERDPNIEAIEIYSPTGGPLGSFKVDSINLLGEPLNDLPQDDSTLAETDSSFFYTHWTASNHRVCCQCTTAGDTRNGYYDYLIHTKVSKASLIKAQNRLYMILALFALFSVIISWVLAKLISLHLVSRLKKLNSQVKDNLNQKGSIKPIDESGSDELSELSKSFNELLEQREGYRKEHIELERLKKKQELADVAAQVSHDIQSPILTLVKIGNDAADKLSPDQRELLKSAASRLTQMTDALLMRYRGEKSEEIHEPAELVPTVESVLKEKKAEYSDHSRLEISFDFYDELTGVKTKIPELALGRILSNLINNAVQASETMHESRVRVKASLSEDNAYVNLSVSDNGPGISANILEKLRHFGGSFLKKTGTGLGLSHARKSLERVGGNLSIYSDVNGGTRVNLRIPTHKAAENKMQPAAMVLVDDDPILRRIWELQAPEMGIELFAIGTADEIPFDKISKTTEIYIDGNLQDESGVEVCKRLHREGYRNLYLSTSDPRIEAPSFVTLVGKEFPFSRSA